jgi:protein ImuB
MLVVWCPDWPVAAAGVPPTRPVAVLHAGRVVACSAAARAEGVRHGQRRREAQSCCPQLELIPYNPDRDAVAFEPVLAAVESLTPKVEVLDPGECAFRARGAARHHGGEAALATAVAAAADQVLGDLGRSHIGIADGRFAATLAARHGPARGPASPGGVAAGGVAAAGLPGAGGVAAVVSGGAAGRRGIVPPGGSASFLAPFPVGVLERPELTDTFVRLGLTTLGHLAGLPRAALAARFGPEGVRAHRLASGLDEYPRATRRPPPDLRAAVELEPPAGRVDVVAFAAKALADELVEHLERLGLNCTRLRIEVETEHGETLARVWRHEPSARPVSRRGSAAAARAAGTPRTAGGASTDPRALQALAMAERVRWQLEGWLAGAAASRPTGAIAHLALVPDEVVPARGRQLGFWSEQAEASQRAARALARVQGLLGPEGVRKVSLRGGRGPADQVVSVAEGELPVTRGEPSTAPTAGSGPPRIPGWVPEPSPGIVHPDPPRAQVLNDQGKRVTVDGRGLLSAPPRWLRVEGGPSVPIAAWTGPWPVDERWWDPRAHRRLARLQVTIGGGTAHLLKLTGGQWWVEATYD